MELKRFLVNKLILFFMLSTLIAVAIYVLGSVFDAQGRFGYDALLTPMKYAGLCLLPTLLSYSGRELSPCALLLRKAAMLILIEAEILLIALFSPVIDTGRVAVIAALMGSVLCIFVFVNLFLWLKDAAEAKKMNRDLRRFQGQFAKNAP